MRTHTGEKPYVCNMQLKSGDICTKAFADKSNLKRHQLVHLDKKDFKCDWKDPETGVACTKAFTRKFILQQHKRTHTGEKPYVCPRPGCDKKFAQKTNMSKHLKAHDGKDGKLAGAGAHAYSEGGTTGGSDESASFKKGGGNV